MGFDHKTMRALFETHGPMVHRRARRILGNDADAEEAVQEVFIRAFSASDAFEQRSTMATWLWRITTHWCLNRIRDARRRQELFSQKVEPAERDHDGPLSHAEVLALRKVLAEADEREAQAAVYVHLDGMSHDEAAELLGVSRRTIGNLVERFATFARARLGEGARRA